MLITLNASKIIDKSSCYQSHPLSFSALLARRRPTGGTFMADETIHERARETKIVLL